MIWVEDIDETPVGPSAEQLEDQVEALADLLRHVYLELGHMESVRADGGDDLDGAIEDLFFELGLEL